MTVSTEMKIEDIVFADNDGIPVVSSVQVAENFEKEHKNILQSIENLKSDMDSISETSAENSANLFIEGYYSDSYDRNQKCYYMNRDGFSLLVMGFTGTAALKWKMKYIEAFNKMERMLSKLNLDERSKNLTDIADRRTIIEKDTHKYSESDLIVWRSCVAHDKIEAIKELYCCENNQAMNLIYTQMGSYYGFDSLKAMKEFEEKRTEEELSRIKISYLAAVADDMNYREMFINTCDMILSKSDAIKEIIKEVYTPEEKDIVEFDRYGSPVLYYYLSEEDYDQYISKVAMCIFDESETKRRTSRLIYSQMYTPEQWEIIQRCWNCKKKKNLVTAVCRYAERFIEVCNDIIGIECEINDVKEGLESDNFKESYIGNDGREMMNKVCEG